MRKLITLFLMFFIANAYLFAYEGGSVSANPGGTTVDPTISVTITYNGSGTNFKNWAPRCHAHMWLNDASGNSIATTTWINYSNGGGDPAWALVPENQKMTKVGSGNTGIYEITLNSLFEYFNVAEVDKSRVAKFGIIVRAEHDGNNNRTESMYLDVAIPTPDPTISLTAPTSVFLDEGITFSATAQNVASPVITYSVQAPGAGSFTTVTSPYQPLVAGEHIFKAEVTEDNSEDVLASDQKTVLVKAVPADIVIRGKKPSDWSNDMHLFVYGTSSDGFKSMTKSGDWYVYTFTRQESVNIIFVNGDAWDGYANQTENVEHVTESTCYQVGEADGGNKRTATLVSCPDPSLTKVTVEAPLDWTNVHFFYWTTPVSTGGGFVVPDVVNAEDNVYRYEFTYLDELNFLVVNGDDWDDSPMKSADVEVAPGSTNLFYKMDGTSEDEKYNIVEVGWKDIQTSVEKTEKEAVIIRVNNNTIDVSIDKQASVELFSITGQLIRSAQNVNSFTQKVNSGVYVLRIDGETRKIIVN